MYPLVRELAVDGIPVVVSCRVLGLARQPYYRWLTEPIVESQLDKAYLANAVFDAHRDDPEFGYRFLADEVRQLEEHTGVSDRVVWRICRRQKTGARGMCRCRPGRLLYCRNYAMGWTPRNGGKGPCLRCGLME